MMKFVGYTLIEIMIALAVFAILATITSAALYHAFDTRARVNEQADRLNALQLAMTLIERDTKQIIGRTIYGNDMRLFPAFVGQANYLEFTRGGLVNPQAIEQRSTLNRVAFICRHYQLIRRSWEKLDAPERQHHRDKVLLDNLAACSFAYLADNRQILPEWREQALQQNQSKEPTIPMAIQLSLNLRDWGEMSLLFILPESLYGG